MKCIQIPFPLIRAAAESARWIAAITRHGISLGIAECDLPGDGEGYPRLYKWNEEICQDGTSLISFKLWMGCGMIIRGTQRGTDGYNGTGWAMETLKVSYNRYAGMDRSKAVLCMDAECMRGNNIQSRMDASLTDLLSVIEAEKEAEAAQDERRKTMDLGVLAVED